MVALDERVSGTLSTTTGNKRAEEGLRISFHFDGVSYLPVLIVSGVTAELARRLGADGEHNRLIGVGAKVQALVMKPKVRGDEVVVVVVVILKPLVVKLAEVAKLALDLHPALSERDVLEIDETGAQTHWRAEIDAPHEVTAT